MALHPHTAAPGCYRNAAAVAAAALLGRIGLVAGGWLVAVTLPVLLLPAVPPQGRCGSGEALGATQARPQGSARYGAAEHALCDKQQHTMLLHIE